MKRECAFTKRFYEHKDWVCEEEKRDLCDSLSCNCACSQIAKMARKCRENYFDDHNYQFFTLFENDNYVCSEELDQLNVEEIKRHFLLKVKRLNIPGLRLIGGFDLQLQDYIDEHRTRKSRWLPHWHCFITSDLPVIKIKEIIYSKFNKGQTKRIALLKHGDDEPFGCRYLFKPIHKFKKKLASTEKGQRKRFYRIKGKARTELREFLMQQNRLDWVALIGFRRYGDRLVPV
jgi:hypothetical protein